MPKYRVYLAAFYNIDVEGDTRDEVERVALKRVRDEHTQVEWEVEEMDLVAADHGAEAGG